MAAEKKKKEEEEERKREQEEEEAREKELQKNNLPYYNKQMLKLGEQNITPGIILEALVDQVCEKKEEDKQKEQDPGCYQNVCENDIMSLFTKIETKMKNPVFH